MAADTSPDDQVETQDGFTGGKLFDTVFARGMALVEETATYLDGPGREAAITLPREAGLTYSAWSKYRIRREEPALDAAAQQGLGLPSRFLDLVSRSEALFEQICRLDDALYGQSRKPAAPNPVIDQISQLQRAAETGAFDPLMVWHRAK